MLPMPPCVLAGRRKSLVQHRRIKTKPLGARCCNLDSRYESHVFSAVGDRQFTPPTRCNRSSHGFAPIRDSDLWHQKGTPWHGGVAGRPRHLLAPLMELPFRPGPGVEASLDSARPHPQHPSLRLAMAGHGVSHACHFLIVMAAVRCSVIRMPLLSLSPQFCLELCVYQVPTGVTPYR